MRCCSAHGNGEGEDEDHEGARRRTSHCEAETAVDISEDESTNGWKEEKTVTCTSALFHPLSDETAIISHW